MRVEVAATPGEFARRAADLLCAALRAKPDAAVGLASGKTPLGMYAELTRCVREQDIDFSGATAFSVDELYGVPPHHLATNASYFQETLPFPLRALHVMDSEAMEPEAECLRFRRLIDEAGGLHLVVLGIGRKGHLAFNEPGSTFDSRARKVALEPSTREAYIPHFGSFDATPAHGLTLGIADLLDANEILLLASGAYKADAVARALEGSMTEGVPASALQRHANVTVLLDRAAAARLRQATS